MGAYLWPRDLARIAPASLVEIVMAQAKEADLIVISGAMAAVDREDVAPEAVTMVGGYVLRFGMPVFPGIWFVWVRRTALIFCLAARARPGWTAFSPARIWR